MPFSHGVGSIIITCDLIARKFVFYNGSGDKRDFYAVFSELSGLTVKNAVLEIIGSLKNDVIVGKHVMKKQIPPYYMARHNVQILYRVKLLHHRRLIYTIITLHEGTKPDALLLDLDLCCKQQATVKKPWPVGQVAGII